MDGEQQQQQQVSVPLPLAPLPSVPPFPPPPVSLPSDAASIAADAEGEDDKDEDMLFEPRQPSPPPIPPSRKEDPASEYEVSDESRKAKERQEQAMQQILLNRRAKALAVPTNDAIVRSRLRSLEQPVTLFGEREMERRQRLRDLMARLDAKGELDRFLTSTHAFAASLADDSATKEDERMEEVQTAPFFTEGSEELLHARIELMKYSIAKAALRISRMKQKRENPDEDEEAELDFVLQRVSQMSMNCSQIGDDRPLSGCAFSLDGAFLATSGWSGATKIWNVETMERATTVRGHNERVTSVAFSPTDKKLATASADKTAILWGLDGSCLKKFEGHLDRLARLAFHPSGGPQSQCVRDRISM